MICKQPSEAIAAAPGAGRWPHGACSLLIISAPFSRMGIDRCVQIAKYWQVSSRWHRHTQQLIHVGRGHRCTLHSLRRRTQATDERRTLCPGGLGVDSEVDSTARADVLRCGRKDSADGQAVCSRL